MRNQNISVAFLSLGAKRGGGKEEKRDPPPFSPSSLSPTPCNPCYAGYFIVPRVPRHRKDMRKYAWHTRAVVPSSSVHMEVTHRFV